MSILNRTPRERLVDTEGRPYFLWDVDMTLEQFEDRLQDPDPDARAYLVAKLMRQARPDDVFTFVKLTEIGPIWPRIARHLGKTCRFWTWWMKQWDVLPDE